MTLPNYFLADLPPQAELTAAMVAEACSAIRRNRDRYLAPRDTRGLIRLLSQVATNWLDPDYPFRRLLLERGPEATGFPREILTVGLDAFFQHLTPENLMALVLQEVGHVQRFEQFSGTDLELKADRAAMVHGPRLLVHIAGGSLPNPALMTLVLGLLARSAQFVKCASGTSLIPRLFAHSLYHADPKLGACLEIAEWKGGTAALDAVLLAEADCVTATGSDETLAAIRRHVPERTRFLGYGHKVSFGYVAQESLGGFALRQVVASAARDVIAWNQMGCLSPHVIYAEIGGSVSPGLFAEMLAQELESRELVQPRGGVEVEEAAAIATRRSFYEVRAAHSLDTKCWFSRGSTAWTVIFEEDPRFTASCLNRFIYVKSVSGLDQVFEGAGSITGKVSTVGLAAPPLKAEQLAMQLARWGVTRICPLGQMQNPPLLWRHDGRPTLGDLVTWCDWEQ